MSAPNSVLDQHQDSTGASFGFGQFAVVRYRGQCFTPSVSGKLATIGFDRNIGSLGVKVYFDNTVSHLPAHAVGSELYSFVIPNASIISGYGTYDLPVPLFMNSGIEYCFYLAPWDTGANAYSDDYQDCHGVSSGSLEMTNTNGSWANEGLTFHYATYVIPSNKGTSIYTVQGFQ